MSAKPVPPGYHTITPHIVVRGAAKAIDFYKRAFGAVELFRHATPDGRLMHAEIRIGDSIVMIGDAFPEMGCAGPEGHSPVTLHLYVPDVDAAFVRAVEHGATVKMPVADMFWGDRYGQLADPFGHSWSVATHVRDVSPQEMEKAAAEMFSGKP